MSDADHPEYRGLLWDVIDSPADDLPRLILADWLDDHGEPGRAEFIRAQCEIAAFRKTELCVYDTRPRYKQRSTPCITYKQGGNCQCKADALAKRESSLWDVCYLQLAAEVNHWLRKPRSTWYGYSARWHLSPNEGDELVATWDRGFVHKVAMRLEAFEKHAAALFARCPVTRVVLTNREPAERPERFTWFGPHPTERRETDESRLPGFLWHALPHVDYSTRDAAVNALSTACVAYGREQAAKSRQGEVVKAR